MPSTRTMAREDYASVVFGEDVGEYGGSYKSPRDLYKKREYGQWRVLDTRADRRETASPAWPSGAAMTPACGRSWKADMGFLLLAFQPDLQTHGDAALHQRRQLHDPQRWVRGPRGVGAPARAEHSQPPGGLFPRRARHQKNRGGEHPHQRKG